ncbi:MAG TPA: winged helix-turn-helix domain-containing protein [Stellaceae bacterium]|nr:winged helix-turn-helix domain-containing protein [Stellaceae bacterium]
MPISFEGFTLDIERRELSRGPQLISIGPQVFDLLVYLVENHHRVVTKDELLDTIWGGRIVSLSTLASHINAVRRAVADSGEEQRLIRTIARKGFRFVGEVRERKPPAEHPELHLTFSGARQNLTFAPDNRPSIAVMPFHNMSDDPGQEYFADGVVEDITTGLSKFRNLLVIARNSSFQYKGKVVDVRQVGHELGVRYLLQGSIRRDRDRVRISAQLIDAETGAHLWAEKYDKDCLDMLGLQDEVTASVVSAIQPELLFGEGRRAARKSPANLDALDCCIRGIWHFHQPSAEAKQQAEHWLRRSIELDGGLARAHVWLARLLFARCWHGSSSDTDRDLAESQWLAERALSLDDRDPECYYNLSVLALMRRRHQRALRTAKRAIDLNENFAHAHFALGETRIFMGDFAEGLEPIARCIRLSPNDPLAPIFFSVLALGKYHLGDYDEAVWCSEEALRRGRGYVALRTLAATLGQLERSEEAVAVVGEMERFKPLDAKSHWSLTCPYARHSDEANFVEGLRKAGCEIPPP